MIRTLRLLAAGLLAVSIGAMVVTACANPAGPSIAGLPKAENSAGQTAAPSSGDSNPSAGGLIDAGGVPCPPGAPLLSSTTQGRKFTATFDGSPASPLSVCGASDWDIQVHSRDASTWLAMDPMEAQHGPDCSAPPASHHLTGSYQDAVFQCRDHIMTAINAAGYGVIYLTPDQLLDFSAGEAMVRFDLSTLRMSSRDWVDIWITPFGENLALPFDQGDVDLQGLPRSGVHISMSDFNGETTFRCNQIADFRETEVESNWWDSIDGRLKASGRAPSATVRDTFELRLSTTHVEFSSPSIPGWVACDAALSRLSFDVGVVQFGHHSYNPAKDGSGVPATWHWDNVVIEPATPFTLIRAGRRAVASSADVIEFVGPAPSGSSLRFAANGANIELSLDDGKTWAPAKVQPAEKDVDRFRSYFTPIPAGTTAVRLRGKDTANGPFFAQDFAIWSLAN